MTEVPWQFYRVPPGTVIARTLDISVLVHVGIKIDDHNVVDFDHRADEHGCHVHCKSPPAFFRGRAWQGRKYEWLNTDHRATVHCALQMLINARSGRRVLTYHPLWQNCVHFCLCAVRGRQLTGRPMGWLWELLKN